jgi:hypothetical protein
MAQCSFASNVASKQEDANAGAVMEEEANIPPRRHLRKVDTNPHNKLMENRKLQEEDMNNMINPEYMDNAVEDLDLDGERKLYR